MPASYAKRSLKKNGNTLCKVFTLKGGNNTTCFSSSYEKNV